MKRLIGPPAIRPSCNKCSKPLVMVVTWCLLGYALLFAASAQAAYDVTIVASGASSGGAWVGNTWTPSANGSTVLASEVATHLSAGATVIGTAGAGADNGDIFVNSAVSWSANLLTLTAQRNIAIKANLNGSGTASLALEYGQGAVNAGNTSTYTVSNGAQINLPAGNNFSAKLGNDVVATTYTVITSLGVEGDATVLPATMTLQGMKMGLAGHYVLGANINASGTSTWNGGLGFNEVGSSWGGPFVPFTGVFDGLGHTITGLTINRVWENEVGLFGYTNGATLRNVGLINSSISGQLDVGALVGLENGSSSISNSYADGGSVTGTNNSIGGLVGAGFGSISNSYANVSVTGGSSGTGGLKGRNDGSITNSYATGSVHGVSWVGGLVGYEFNGTISNSYATGAVTATNATVGGLVGTQVGGGTTNSYWDKVTTGRATSASGTGVDTTALMQTQATFTGFDFTVTPVWRIYAGHTAPLLASFLTPLTVTANAASKAYDGLAYSGGNGVSYSTAPNANLLGAVSYSGTSQGAISPGSYVITPSGLYSNQKGYDITAYVNGVLTILPSYTGATATGAGNATATASGGGAGSPGCDFTTAQFIPLVGHAASPPAGSAPANVSFPQGLFDFTIGGCTPSGTITLTITYPQALPPGAVYWKYGPTPSDASYHWYQLPATIAGATATFSITDGGLGDDDLVVNGIIVDQGGPGVGVSGVPTLSEWALLTLVGLVGLFGMGAVRRPENAYRG